MKRLWKFPPDSHTHKILFLVVPIIILILTLSLLGR